MRAVGSLPGPSEIPGECSGRVTLRPAAANSRQSASGPGETEARVIEALVCAISRWRERQASDEHDIGFDHRSHEGQA